MKKLTSRREKTTPPSPQRYRGEEIRHIGQGCVYFYSGDSMDHLTDYVRRGTIFGVRVLPILVIDRDCRIYADCPRYSPREWLPEMVSVAPPACLDFDDQDVLKALREIEAENDRVKSSAARDLVTTTKVTGRDRLLPGGKPTSALRGLARRAARPRDGDGDRLLRFFRAGRPLPCRYLDDAVMILPYRHDGEVIAFETYKEWVRQEAVRGVPDGKRLPLEFHAPLYALELFLKERGITRFNIVNLDTLRIL